MELKFIFKQSESQEGMRFCRAIAVTKENRQPWGCRIQYDMAVLGS
jgi:hypothetical protein